MEYDRMNEVSFIFSLCAWRNGIANVFMIEIYNSEKKGYYTTEPKLIQGYNMNNTKSTCFNIKK